MDNFEQLEQEIYDEGIEIDFIDFKSDRIKGLCCNDSIALSKSLHTSAERACVAAEELAHHQLTTGYIIDLCDIRSRKQEYQARLRAYDKQIGLWGLIRAYEHGCHDRCEMADFLDVTEDFLAEAIRCYTSKYGRYVVVDNYIISFIPGLGVARMFQD